MVVEDRRRWTPWSSFEGWSCELNQCFAPKQAKRFVSKPNQRNRGPFFEPTKSFEPTRSSWEGQRTSPTLVVPALPHESYAARPCVNIICDCSTSSTWPLRRKNHVEIWLTMHLLLFFVVYLLIVSVLCVLSYQLISNSWGACSNVQYRTCTVLYHTHNLAKKFPN